MSDEDESHLVLDKLDKLLVAVNDLKSAKSEIEVLHKEIEGLRLELQNTRSDIQSLTLQTSMAAEEIRSMRSVVSGSLEEIARVIKGAANLNDKMPKFLESIRTALFSGIKRTANWKLPLGHIEMFSPCIDTPMIHAL